MKKTITSLILIFALMLSLAACGANQPGTSDVPENTGPAVTESEPEQTPEPVVDPYLVADIPYIDDGSSFHLLDVHGYEEGGEKKPVIIQIHGGAMSSGDKSANTEYADYLESFGFAVVNINYTLLPYGTVQDLVQDMAAVLQWIVDNSEQYNLDINNVIISGESAGGFCAATLSLVVSSPKLQAYYEVTVPDELTVRATGLSHPMTKLDSQKNVQKANDDGVTVADVLAIDGVLEMTNLVNLIEYVGVKDYPEFFLICNPGDPVCYEVDVELHEALTEAGISHEFHECQSISNKLAHIFNVNNLEWEESIAINEALVEYFKNKLAREVLIACIGDSITHGAGTDKPSTEAYPVVLDQLFGEGFEVKNFGRIGATASVNGDNPYIGGAQYNLSLETPADVYIIMLGTNDSKPYNWDPEDYRAGLEELIDTYRGLNPNALIYLMTSPHAYEYNGPNEDLQGKVQFDIQSDVVENEVYPIITSVTQEQGTKLIDIFAFTEGQIDWYKDGIHPAAEGCAAIAQYVYEQIQEDVRAIQPQQ